MSSARIPFDYKKQNGTDNGLYLKLLPTSARWATVLLAVYSLRQHFGPQPKWQSVGRLCLDLAQLVCLSLSLVEPGKIIYIFLFTVYRILLCLSPMTSRILAKELSLTISISVILLQCWSKKCPTFQAHKL